MSWARFDDDLPFNPKIVSAGNEAVGAWVRMICWSAGHGTNGRVRRSVALLIAGGEKKLASLVKSGLLDINGNDFVVHDFLDFNPSAEEVEAARAARSEAGKRGGIRSGEARRRKRAAKTNQEQSGNEASASFEGSKNEANAQASEKQKRSANEAKTNPDPDPVLIQRQRSEESNSPAASQPEPIRLDLQEPRADRRRAPAADVQALISAYCARWVEVRRPLDGKPPKLSRADSGQAAQLVRDHGLDQALEFVHRYLADDDKWIVQQGHPLALVARRINAYRATSQPVAPKPQSGFQEPRPAVATTKEVKV